MSELNEQPDSDGQSSQARSLGHLGLSELGAVAQASSLCSSANEPASPDRWYQTAAAAALAAGTAVLCASDASAEIISYTTDLTTTGTHGQQAIFFDFVSGQSLLGKYQEDPFGSPEGEPPAWAQFALGRFGNFGALIDLAEHNEAMGNLIPGYYEGNFYPNPFKLGDGAAIGPGGQFNPAPPQEDGSGFIQSLATSAGDYGNWQPLPSSKGYLGLRFGDGTNFNYGWAEISFPDNPAANITLHAFAYNTTPNQLLLAGQLSGVAGDMNADGKVDLDDFGILKANFGTGTTLAQGDTNSDGKVDLADFGILKANFGAGGVAAAVPEPPAITLLLLGAAGVGAYRARRKSEREVAETC